jgi:hypothetical protein
MYDWGTSAWSCVAQKKTFEERGTIMITFIRSAVIAPGKVSDALAFAHKIAKHITEKYGTAVDLQVPVGGNPSRIAWLAHYDSLAQYETLSSKLLADKDYLDAIAITGGVFVPGSLHDEIWRKI